MKTCNVCKEKKDFSAFSKKSSAKDKLASACKSCRKIYSSRYYKLNKESSDTRAKNWRRDNLQESRAITRKSYHKYFHKQRARTLKKNYGLTMEQYNKMLEEQDGVCAICHGYQSDPKIALAVDHDHNTGLIRGLLCNPCNKSLGLLKESPSTLYNAINYLNKYNSRLNKNVLEETKGIFYE